RGRRTAVRQARQREQTALEGLMAGPTGQVGDEADAAHVSGYAPDRLRSKTELSDSTHALYACIDDAETARLMAGGDPAAARRGPGRAPRSSAAAPAGMPAPCGQGRAPPSGGARVGQSP